MKKKRAFIFMLLLMIAIGLGAFNYYLWHLQIDKRQYIVGLQAQVAVHEIENNSLQHRNASKAQEIKTLRSPESFYVYEEKARKEYGMIGSNETFFVLKEEDFANIPDVSELEQTQGEGLNYVALLPQGMMNETLTLESLGQEDDAGMLNATDIPPVPPLQLESLQTP